MFEDQVNANLMIALFPFGSRSAPLQNNTLLNIFSQSYWHADGSFRLHTGTDVLFAHGEPTIDVVDRLVRCLLSWNRPYSELDALIGGVALPIHKHWERVAGGRVVDACLVLLRYLLRRRASGVPLLAPRRARRARASAARERLAGRQGGAVHDQSNARVCAGCLAVGEEGKVKLKQFSGCVLLRGFLVLGRAVGDWKASRKGRGREELIV